MGTIAIFGDPHLGADGCLKEEFFAALESVAEEMDLILFNGDFIDSYDEKGRKALDGFIAWVEMKDWKEKIVFITGGMGHEGNILFDYPTIQVLPWAILNTKEGRIIVCHGYNIGLKKGINETWSHALVNLKNRLIKNKASFLPQILSTNKIIISHTHVPVFNMENGVFATGSWLLKEELVDNEDFVRRIIGVYIVKMMKIETTPLK